MPGFYDQLDEAVSRYGGADEAYKNKLKKEVRESLGYSNYVSQRNAASKKPLDLSLMKGNITPGGVKELVRGSMDIKNQEVDAYQTMAEKTNQAAESIAVQKLADSKRAAKEKENLQFKPTNWAEAEIVNYMKNPYNQDGSIKTKDQLKEQLMGQLVGEGTGMGVTPQAIEQKINEWIPADFDSNPGEYSYRAMGYTKEQAKDLVNYNRYANGQMGENEKTAYAMANPTWANRADELAANKNLLPDIGTKIDEITGEEVPKYNYEELVRKYPNVDPKFIGELAKPAQTPFLQDDIRKNLLSSNSTKSLATAIENNKLTENDYIQFMDSDDYKNFKRMAILSYGPMYTDQELDFIIHQMIMDEL